MISYEELKRRRAADKHKNEGGDEQPEISYEEIKWKRKGYTPEEARQALNSISTRLSSWERGYNALTTDYSDRFVDMTGSYKDKYLGETGNWLADYTARKSNVVAEADQLRRLVDQHRSILGTDANKILESLEGAAAGLDKMQQGYTTYNNFYGQFEGEDAYKQWQDNYFHTAEGAAADRQAWEKETREKIRTMPAGAERNELEDKLRRYERGEGEWGTYSKFVEKGDPLEKTASAYQTGFTNSLMDRGVVALQDQEFLNLAERTAAAVHIPDAEEAARYDKLKHAGYDMVYPEYGQPYAVSRYDGAVMVYRNGEYIHPELLTGQYNYSDKLGIYLSMDAETEGEIDTSLTNVRSQAVAEARTKHWDMLKPEEITVYYGLLGQEPATAAQYLEQLQPTLNHRFQNQETMDTVKAYREARWDEKAGMSLTTVPANLASGVTGFITIALDKLRGKDTDFYGRGFEGMHYSNTVRGERAAEFNTALPNLNILGLGAGDIYQAGMSGLDSLSMAFVPGGAAVLGMGAGANKGYELHKSGASQDQIFKGAVTSAAIEGAMEKIGLDNLKFLKAKDVTRWVDFALNVLKQSGTEYLEEFGTEIANGFADLFNRTSESDWAKLWERHNGNFFAVAGDVLKQAHEAGMAGAFSGGGHAVTVGTVNAGKGVNASRYTGSQIKAGTAGMTLEQLKALAGTVDPAVDPNLAGYAEKTTEESSDGRVGNLYRRTVAGMQSTAVTDALRQIEAEGYSPEQAEQILEVADRINAGQRLTEKQQALWEQVESNPNVMEAASVLVGIDDNTRKRGNLFVGRDREQEQEESKDPYALLRESVNPQTIGNESAPQPAMQAAPQTRGAVTGAEQNAANQQAETSAQQAYGLRNDNANQNGGMNDANAQYAAAQGTADGGSVLYGGGQRNDGESAGQPVGGLGSRAGQDPQRRSDWADSRREGVRRKNLIQDIRGSAEAVSSKSQGIQTGTDNATMRIVPEEKHTEAMKAEAERIYQETGKQVRYVVGPIEIVGKDGKTRSARGITTADGIFVRLDHSTPAEKIGRHESFHGMLDAYGEFTGRKTILDGILEELRKNFTPEQIESVLTRYHEALRGVYSADRNSMDQNILEEMLADAYAGINSFGAGATKFSEAVQGFMRDNHMSRETVQENGTRQTNAPPAEGRTLQQEIEAQWSGEPAGQKENTAESGGERYSISPSLDSDLQKVLDNTFNSKNNEVYIGETSNFLTNVIGARSLRVTMPASKAYSAMVTLEQAMIDSRYSEKNNYHGLGKDGLLDALIKSEDPIAAFVGTEDENGKRVENIVLVTDMMRGKSNIVVVETVDADGWIAGKRISANKVITSYDRNTLPYDIFQAALNGQLLYLDEKRSQHILAGMPGSDYRGAIQGVDFNRNIQEFWANVKWKKSGKVSQSASGNVEGQTAFARAYQEAQNKRQNKGKRSTDRMSIDDSEVDSAGNPLSVDQQAYFAESKERDNDGNLRVMYRGDSQEVMVFDRKKSKASNLYGRGFYFTAEQSHAGQYGTARAFYLNAVNPLTPGQHNITKDQMLRFLKTIEEDGEDYDLYNYGENATAHSVLQMVWGKGDFEMLQDVSASAIGDLVAAAELFNEVNGTSYDSIRVPTETVIFSSEQAKLISNKNPSSNPDVRYSVDDTDADVAAEAKEQLVEALQGIAPQKSMDGHIRQLIDQYTTEQPVKPQAPKLKVDRGNLRRALNSSLGISEADAGKLAQALDAYTEAVSPKKPAKKQVELDVESKPTRAKRNLQDKLLNLFSIPTGQRAAMNSYIGSWADRIVKNGALTEADRKAFFAKMYESGAMTMPGDEYGAAVREYMKGGRIYVADSVVADFGDDWESIRKRAFAAGIYLTRQRVTDGKQNAGIDSWNGELAEQLPWLFDSEATDRRSMLEQIVKLAEEGKEEKISLAEYTAILAEQEFVSEAEVLDNLERQMDFALRTFAEAADIEIQLKERNLRQRLKEQADNKEARDKRKAANELRELQQRTLKTLQWLNRNRNRAPEELREAWDEVLGDIDLYAVGAANEMNWSEKHNATWKDLAQIYKDAMTSDPNFLPSEELQKIVTRLDATKIGDMDLGALQDLYKAAIGLRTEFHNRNNVINDDMQRLFAEVYTDSKKEIESAPGGYTGKGLDKLFNMEQLHPMNYLQRMGGWDPNGAFYSMAKQLEKGERDIRRYTVQANAMLQEYLEENQEWVKRADGQGKDGIWYEVEIPELLALELGKKPEFGNTVKVYMTPAQKVHLYLESKNQDNLRHMTGGRTFVDRELYSKGKRQEALSQGRTIRMAPETVKKIVADLTQEEMELARLLENYYNSFATGEINRVSNILYGYDKAMGKNYAPIYTNRNYTKTEFGVFDVTAEGVGNLKGRQHAVNPSYNISALDAFERHVDQTARFVGMAIPARNWTTLMNWREKNNSTADVITHKWGEEGKNYITDLITTLQAGDEMKQDVASSNINKLMSNYISAVFGANPSIVLKQLGSIPLAGAYLGMSNLPTPAQMTGIDRKLIEKYTPDLTWRTMGYTTMETKHLKENPNWTQTNKFFRFTFGGGAITAMDGWAASTLWPWAENKVRKEFPNIEVGTQEQIDNGESPFYKKVAELFEDAVSRSQSVSDEIHQGRLRKSKNPLTRAFTLFRSDSAQTYNTIRQKIGEAQYLKRSGANEEAQKAARVAVGASVGALLVNALWGEAVTFLMALWKNKGKKYRDEEDDEMTVGSVLSESVMNILGQLAGVVTFGEEIFDAIGAILTGEKWYGIDTPGMEQLNDMVEAVITAGGNMKGVVAGAVDVLQGGGDLGKYFASKSGMLTGVVKDVAEAAGMFLGGLPVGNVEGYLMGLLKWISPELGAGYDDLFTDPGKSELEGLTGNALSSRMQRVLDDRGVEVDDQTAKELGTLYEAGHSGAFPADVPGSITIKEKTHELSAMQQQTYDRVWSGVVASALDELVGSEAYRNADKKTRAKMLGRLYSYANGRAKDALFDDYELTDTDAKTAKTVAGGIDLASYVAWASTTGEMKTHEKFAELAEWDLDEKAKKALVGAILGTDMKTENGNPTQYAKFLTAVEGGLSVDEYIDLRADGVEIDKYLKYQKAGLDPDAAADLSKTMDALEGEDEDLSDVQKWRAAVDSQADVSDQLAALSVVMTESQHRKATVANEYQLRPKTWVQVQEMLPRYDADGNGSYKQAEVKTAVDAIGRSMGLSDKQKAAMWQLITGSTSAKNNPYSTSVGQQVIDKVNKLKQSDDGNSLSFSEEIAKQFAARW